MPKKKKNRSSKKRKNRRVKKKKARPSLRSVEQKLDLILKKEKKQLKGQKKFFKLERQQLEDADEFEKLERRQLKDLAEIEGLQKEIKKQISPHPLRNITLRDMSKALIGAFVGIIAHFSFAKGAQLAAEISIGRASFIYLVSFLIGFIFIYFTGYRKVVYRKLLLFLPLRLTLIYIVTLATVFFVLYLFNFTVGMDASLIYKQVAVISLPAIIGASAADLIGK